MADLAPWQKEFFKTQFEFQDTNKNGVLTKSDFEERAKGTSESLGFDLDKILPVWIKRWNGIRDVLKKEDGDSVTLDEFYVYVKELQTNDKLFQTVVVDFVAEFVSLADQNKDGKISWDELKEFYAKAFPTIPEDKVKSLFQSLDKDADGFITREECQAHYTKIWRPTEDYIKSL